MFGGASNLAEGVDKAFIFIFSIAGIFIIGLTALMIFIVIHFNKNKGKEPRQFTGSVKLELLWTIIPLILVLLMFYYGWMGFRPMRNVPENAMRIKAIGRMWQWEFDYGNGKLSDTLVVPLNIPVRLDLVAKDVNHSLFIPAFRVKEDVVPGYNNFLWFTPIYIGEYDLLCTEYCGTLHWDMVTKTRVVEPEKFDLWLANLEAKSEIPDPKGLISLKSNNCLACHSLDGSKLLGPTFKGLYGSKKIVVIKNSEKEILVDDGYLKKAIYEPNAEIVKGFNKNLMQSYTKIIKEEELTQIIDYLKQLNDKE